MEAVLAISVSEAARKLSVSRATLYRMIARSEFPSVRIGRTVRIPIHLMEHWLLERAASRSEGI